MEGIPFWGAPFYAGIVALSPFIRDFYNNVVDEVSTRAPAGMILDIGSGPGHVPIQIAGRAPGADIDGIDISPAMVQIAVDNALRFKVANRVHFRYGSAERIPFTDGSFDLVLATLSFHHWARPENCLKEVVRVLKTGGELWIYEIKRDLTPENRLQVRQKYGAFLSFMVFNFVRAHSSVSNKRIQQIQTYTNLGFSRTAVEDKGAFIKLKLFK